MKQDSESGTGFFDCWLRHSYLLNKTYVDSKCEERKKIREGKWKGKGGGWKETAMFMCS